MMTDDSYALASAEADTVTFISEARVPTPHGTFTMKLFKELPSGREHVAMVMGDLANTTVLTRIHSECMTGDVFASLRCDCGPQLQASMEQIGKAGKGLVLYLRQEGRGIGLANKLRAYALQDQGLDTVQANERLGFAPDLRSFAIAAKILEYLDVHEIRLLTNNPKKLLALEKAGIKVLERLPIKIAAQSENAYYLQTKANKMGHQL